MERVSGVHCTVGESPTWHAEEGAWYWVDIPARRIWRLHYASGATRCWETQEMAACVSPAARGGLIAGMETGIFHLVLREDGGVDAERLAAPPSSELGEGMRFNDGRCDRQGRFWAGTMFMDMSAERAVGNLYRFTSDGGLSGPFVSGMLTQNGTAFSPRGDVMYLSDSHPKRRMVWAFDYDIGSGTPHNKRVFLDLGAQKGRPDGAAVDADGCYWTCANDGGVLQRYTPAGTLDREIALPFAKPSMCSFGGPDLSTLLVTSINPGNSRDEWSGSIVLVRPGASGLAEVMFVDS
jgi:sugar lactone lactonase YvrE